MIIHDDFAGELTRFPFGDAGGTGNRNGGIITDGGYRSDHTGQRQFQGLRRIGGQPPVLCHGGFREWNIPDFSPEVIAAHESGDHGGQGGVGSDHHDPQGPFGLLRCWLGSPQVGNIRLLGDLIQ